MTAEGGDTEMSKNDNSRHNVPPAPPAGTVTSPAPPADAPKAEVKPTAVAIDPKVLESLPEDVRALVASYSAITDPEVRTKFVANANKVVASEKQTKEQEAFGEFNKKAEPILQKAILDLMAEMGVSLLGRKLVIAFPEGGGILDYEWNGKTTKLPKPASITNAVMTKAPSAQRTGGNGHGGGFKSTGKAVESGVEYNSLHSLCLAKRWKYEGRPSAQAAVEAPQYPGPREGGTAEQMGKPILDGSGKPLKNTVEKVGDKFVVTSA